jgi:MmyB-like transcription regulator ligand binding domain
LERGDLAGASDSVLEALARALQLDDAERAHLFDLARAAQPVDQPPRRRPAKYRIRPSVQQVLDAITAAGAHIGNDRLDILGANGLGRTLFLEMFDGQQRPNTARFVFLDPMLRVALELQMNSLCSCPGFTDVRMLAANTYCYSKGRAYARSSVAATNDQVAHGVRATPSESALELGCHLAVTTFRCAVSSDPLEVISHCSGGPPANHRQGRHVGRG